MEKIEFALTFQIVRFVIIFERRLLL